MTDALTYSLLRRIAESIRILNTNNSHYMKEIVGELHALRQEIADLKKNK